MGTHDGSHLRYAATVDFARKLRRLMAKAQLSQSDLARECWGEEETSDGYLGARGRDKINRYVTGKTMPDPESLRLMAKALGVPEAELAPTVVGSVLEREHPEVRVTLIAGHREHGHLTLDTVMSWKAILQILAIHEAEQTRGATEQLTSGPPCSSPDFPVPPSQMALVTFPVASSVAERTL